MLGDRGELAQALDNLIANAIEHGGPAVSVEARLARGLLRVGVGDRGRPRPPVTRPRPRPGVRAAAGRRHGHGLRVVRRTAARHGGEFSLRRRGPVTEAVLELPLAGAGER